ncbi:MAG: hypothetical protein QMD85_00955, partial [Candidatus Aenigmarchaeota archaeon]|nr:hypothetical protein [Candidatus Aenigmarchaeota archaeon]MDI6722108.1 hypothetical protein [Candidatus Aenigmarchaeota archaeon]
GRIGIVTEDLKFFSKITGKAEKRNGNIPDVINILLVRPNIENYILGSYCPHNKIPFTIINPEKDTQTGDIEQR